MNVWVVSDTHFNHIKVLKSQRNDFNSVKEMNKFLIEQWNDTVGEDDVVYHLGDFAFGDIANDPEYKQQTLDIYSQLKGKIRLIIGNHDTSSKIKFYIQSNMFDQILPTLYLGDLVLSHHPVHPDTFKEEHLFNIHGHMHLKDVKDTRYFNVNWDRERKIYNLDKLHFELIHRNRNRKDERYHLESFEKKFL